MGTIIVALKLSKVLGLGSQVLSLGSKVLGLGSIRFWA